MTEPRLVTLSREIADKFDEFRRILPGVADETITTMVRALVTRDSDPMRPFPLLRPDIPPMHRDIMEAMRTHVDATVTASLLASRLGRNKHSVAHHLRMMEKDGMVVVRFKESNGTCHWSVADAYR